MSQFNIQNSKVEQLNDSGNNYKLVNKDGNNAISKEGEIVQTAGTLNKVQADHGQGFWSILWTKITGLWTWIVG
jgi:hypothetical protein